jgi:hypothetical protein
MLRFICTELSKFREFLKEVEPTNNALIKKTTLETTNLVREFIFEYVESDYVTHDFLIKKFDKIDDIFDAEIEMPLMIMEIKDLVEKCLQYISVYDEELNLRIQERMTKVYDQKEDYFESRKDDLEHCILGAIHNAMIEESCAGISKNEEFLSKEKILKVLKKVKKLIEK